ncbi:MAG: hypothetical protein EOO73_25505 [Myxococcales bacterium]|nr:MAG: hypothetical protein EOO73_25505 [Myxococcales bacterium]
MRRAMWGAGAVVWGALCGCGGNEPEPGSTVSQPGGGSAGGGQAGSLNLGLEGGKGGGGGAGGAGGAGAGGTAAGSSSTAGASSGGAAGSAASGGGGSGGMKPASACTRAAGSDADCADFWAEEGYLQAYACTDISAAARLGQSIGEECASVSFVAGAAYGACCTPFP